MISYDTDKMHAHVDGVRRWADVALLWYTFVGLLLGACGGYGASLGAVGGDDTVMRLVTGAIIGAVIGAAIGSGYAFIIRVVMHTMLCLAQIEQNTYGIRCDLAQPSEEQRKAPEDHGPGTFLLAGNGAVAPASDDRGVSRNGEALRR